MNKLLGRILKGIVGLALVGGLAGALFSWRERARTSARRKNEERIKQATDGLWPPIANAPTPNVRIETNGNQSPLSSETI